MRVLIRGAGDLASGVALRLHRAGFAVAMTDLPYPTAIPPHGGLFPGHRPGRDPGRGCDGPAGHSGHSGGPLGQRGNSRFDRPRGRCKEVLSPHVLVDAILAKRNCGTAITDAPLVIALGPGFTAGVDCHAVVETMRGHTLGRVIWDGPALPKHQHPRPHRRICRGTGAAGAGRRRVYAGFGHRRHG